MSQTNNKSTIRTWKIKFLVELRSLEYNINQLYDIIGINQLTIIAGRGSGDDEDDIGEKFKPKLNENSPSFRETIDEYVEKSSKHVQHICTLISSETDFDLPIPIFVLIRIANKIGSIRWNNFDKPPRGTLRQYVYSLTPKLVDLNLIMQRCVIEVLGKNIIPFLLPINQSICRILEWTRSSNLKVHDANQFHTTRSKLLSLLSFIFEELSLNINLEPTALRELIEVELIENCRELIVSEHNTGPSLDDSSQMSLKDIHLFDSLDCLEKTFLVYAEYLDAPLENKVKSFVIKVCLEIYRDIESPRRPLADASCRRKLLNLLEVIASRPYASSTTEISSHIFELASRLECDPQVRSLARRALLVGLAHRPIVVSHHDVYKCYGRPMLERFEADPPKAIEDGSSTIETTTEIEIAEAGQRLIVEPPSSPQPTSDTNDKPDESEKYLQFFVEKLGQQV